MQHASGFISTLLIFLRLGLTSFGGPVAHLAFFRHEFVERRRWLSDQQYADLVALCQFLPGPASSQVGLALGWSRGGYSGALAAWLGFTLPSALLLVLLALGLTQGADWLPHDLLQGLKVAAVAVVAHAVWGMARSFCTDWLRRSMMLVAALSLILLPGMSVQLLVLLLGGLIGLMLLQPSASNPSSAVPTTSSPLRHTTLLWLLLFAAQRPVHPFGKCSVTTTLIAHVIVDKYQYGMPLYRQESKFKGLGQPVYRNNMAQWCIRFGDAAKPLLQLIREVQNSGNYLQADETRLQVLKEDGKTAQSDKWMWVIRGGPPEKLSVLFEYDPSRAGSVAVRLLDDFKGVLQADGFSGYNAVCKANSITRIGCWDHARRKFVEADKGADSKAKAKKGTASKADVALSYIRKLYRIESNIADKTDEERLKARQEISVPVLDEFKLWLEKNAAKIMKGGALRKAIDYTLNQWQYLVGYCERGDLKISNALAENAIRPFAIGRKNWLFADTRKGAEASAACYSLIETAKANHIDPQAYIKHILDRIAVADTLEKLEALLPWNVELD